MKKLLGVLCAITAGLAASPGFAAKGHDPDWPCIQRKVPELSMPQIWNGPELPEAANSWNSDAEISEMVRELAARRVPVEEAQQSIRAFAERLSPQERADKITKLVRGLFDHMNIERSQVISGIGRYARGQAEIAARLRKEASALGELQAKQDADILEVQRQTDR